jgi:hypothetical protein
MKEEVSRAQHKAKGAQLNVEESAEKVELLLYYWIINNADNQGGRVRKF